MADERNPLEDVAAGTAVSAGVVAALYARERIFGRPPEPLTTSQAAAARRRFYREARLQMQAETAEITARLQAAAARDAARNNPLNPVAMELLEPPVEMVLPRPANPTRLDVTVSSDPALRGLTRSRAPTVIDLTEVARRQAEAAREQAQLAELFSAPFENVNPLTGIDSPGNLADEARRIAGEIGNPRPPRRLPGATDFPGGTANPLPGQYDPLTEVRARISDRFGGTPYRPNQLPGPPIPGYTPPTGFDYPALDNPAQRIARALTPRGQRARMLLELRGAGMTVREAREYLRETAPAPRLAFDMAVPVDPLNFEGVRPERVEPVRLFYRDPLTTEMRDLSFRGGRLARAEAIAELREAGYNRLPRPQTSLVLPVRTQLGSRVVTQVVENPLPLPPSAGIGTVTRLDPNRIIQPVFYGGGVPSGFIPIGWQAQGFIADAARNANARQLARIAGGLQPASLTRVAVPALLQEGARAAVRGVGTAFNRVDMAAGRLLGGLERAMPYVVAAEFLSQPAMMAANLVDEQLREAGLLRRYPPFPTGDERYFVRSVRRFLDEPLNPLIERPGLQEDVDAVMRIQLRESEAQTAAGLGVGGELEERRNMQAAAELREGLEIESLYQERQRTRRAIENYQALPAALIAGTFGAVSLLASATSDLATTVAGATSEPLPYTTGLIEPLDLAEPAANPITPTVAPAVRIRVPRRRSGSPGVSLPYVGRPAPPTPTGSNPLARAFGPSLLPSRPAMALVEPCGCR